jgi:transcriptional regulator with PAS, ATPase and Fis domain
MCVIAAAHDDLVDKARFRADLYYRINVVSIVMPQLADRDGGKALA